MVIINENITFFQINNLLIKMDFKKVYTRQVHSVAVATCKAEEKMIEEESYVPPPGHISVMKGKINDGVSGRACVLAFSLLRALHSSSCRGLHWGYLEDIEGS